jgi:RecB family exonuclease
MSHKITLTTGEVLTLPVAHLSPSAADTFIKCPMTYYWRYVEGRKDPPGIAQVNGSSGHTALEINNRHKKKTGEDLPAKTVAEAYSDTLADAFKTVEDKEGYTLDSLRDATVPALDQYMEEDAPSIMPVGVEQPFQVDVLGLPIRGFIDITSDKGWVRPLNTQSSWPPTVRPCRPRRWATTSSSVARN